MILPFSTQMNGKPTYFVERIWKGLFPIMLPLGAWFPLFKECRKKELIPKGINVRESLNGVIPKIHTIREDKNDRWKVGTKIDFFINVRQKNMFRFAPVLPVVSVQKVEIEWHLSENKKPEWYKNATVCVDEIYLNASQVEILSLNDGFDTVEDFFAYFDKDFQGKIIHWTDLRY